MKKILLLVLLMFVLPAYAATWQELGNTQHMSSGNYVGGTQREDDRLMFASNVKYATCSPWAARYYRKWKSNANPCYPAGQDGRIWLQATDGPLRKFDEAFNPLTPSQLQGWTHPSGAQRDWVRTVGLAYDGDWCYMQPHVGPEYGNPGGYNYVPALATSTDCINWVYEGPVTINGVYPNFFSSSMGYIVENWDDDTQEYDPDNVYHYMVQDGVPGYGKLRIFKSTGGLDYQPIGTDIIATHYPGGGAVWPDMVECNGKYHLVFEDGWGNSTTRIRHLTADYLEGPWTVLQDDIGINDYKGLNMVCMYNPTQGEQILYGVAKNSKKMYKWH